MKNLVKIAKSHLEGKQTKESVSLFNKISSLLSDKGFVAPYKIAHNPFGPGGTSIKNDAGEFMGIDRPSDDDYERDYDERDDVVNDNDGDIYWEDRIIEKVESEMSEEVRDRISNNTFPNEWVKDMFSPENNLDILEEYIIEGEEPSSSSMDNGLKTLSRYMKDGIMEDDKLEEIEVYYPAVYDWIRLYSKII